MFPVQTKLSSTFCPVFRFLFGWVYTHLPSLAHNVLQGVGLDSIAQSYWGLPRFGCRQTHHAYLHTPQSDCAGGRYICQCDPGESVGHLPYDLHYGLRNEPQHYHFSDLSWNHLKEIPEKTFAGQQHLRQMYVYASVFLCGIALGGVVIGPLYPSHLQIFGWQQYRGNKTGIVFRSVAAWVVLSAGQ